MKRKKGFTLVELLVAMSILAILLLLLTTLLDSVQKTYNYAENSISQFREARVAFDIITKNLGQASLNNYWDYHYENNRVTNYKRQSDLHFKTLRARELNGVDGQAFGEAIFFQAPLGFSSKFRNLNNLFNARGYYVVYGDDSDFVPKLIRSGREPRLRYRLMEYRPPAEENQVYIDGDDERTKGAEPRYDKWYQHDLREFSHPLAENIIALVFSPRDTLESSGDNSALSFSRIAPDFDFDSNTNSDPRYVQQLPPLVVVTLVAIDEQSAIRLGDDASRLVSPSIFSSSSQLQGDIDDLKEDFESRRIGHKVFSTVVAIRSSKWSGENPQ